MVRISDIAFLMGPLVLGFGSGRLLTPNEFRQCGAKSPLQPPGWAFGVAWTILYLLAGAACAHAWRASGRQWTRGLVATVIALLFLMVWWIVFANWCSPTFAFATIVPSTGLVVVAVSLLWADGNRTAAALLSPLVLWMTFASILSSYPLNF